MFSNESSEYMSAAKWLGIKQRARFWSIATDSAASSQTIAKFGVLKIANSPLSMSIWSTDFTNIPFWTSLTHAVIYLWLFIGRSPAIQCSNVAITFRVGYEMGSFADLFLTSLMCFNTASSPDTLQQQRAWMYSAPFEWGMRCTASQRASWSPPITMLTIPSLNSDPPLKSVRLSVVNWKDLRWSKSSRAMIEVGSLRMNRNLRKKDCYLQYRYLVRPWTTIEYLYAQHCPSHVTNPF